MKRLAAPCAGALLIIYNKVLSISFTDRDSGQSQGVHLSVRKQKLPSLLPWHYLCRSLSCRPVTLLWLFCWPYNGFLCTYATRKLAEMIFFSCLARLQLRNKLLMEARGRLLIIGASHPVDLFPTLFSSFAIAQLQWQEKRKQSVPQRTHNLYHLSQGPGTEWQGLGSLQPILWFPRGLKGIAQAYSLFMSVNFHISLHLVAHSWDSRPSGTGAAVGHRLFARRQQNIRKSSILSALCTTYKYNFIGGGTKILERLWKAVHKVGGLHTILSYKPNVFWGKTYSESYCQTLLENIQSYRVLSICL